MKRFVLVLVLGVMACGDEADSLRDGGSPSSVLDARVPALDAALDVARDASAPPELVEDEFPFGPHFKQISVGHGRVCTIDGDGGLRCFYSKLDQFPVPPELPMPHGVFTQVDVSEIGAVCALRSDGAFLCFRDDGSSIETPSGVFTDISVGAGFGCGVRSDGRLACWQQRVLTIPPQSPPEVPPGSDYVDVEVDTDYACARAQSGRTDCWYAMTSPYTAAAPMPSEPLRSLTDSCGLRDDGSAVCWGYLSFPARTKFAALRTSYQMGCGIALDGQLSCFSLASDVPFYAPPGADYASISVGDPVACALRRDGASACWRVRATSVEHAPADQFTQVSVGQEPTESAPAGSALACGVRTDGTLRCWGGTGEYELPQGRFRSVKVGYEFGCALREEGSLACFGAPWLLPPDPMRRGYTQLDVETFLACALDEAGAGTCWGNQPPIPGPGPFKQLQLQCGLRTNGELECFHAQGACSAASPCPEPPAGAFEQLDADGSDACAVRADGTVACWSLFPGVTARDSPAGQFMQVSVSKTHNTAIRADGTLRSWPAPTSRRNAKHWPPAGRYTQVSAGEHVDCAVRDDGRAVCWPYEGYALPTTP